MSPIVKLCGVLAVFALAVLAIPVDNKLNKEMFIQPNNKVSHVDHGFVNQYLRGEEFQRDDEDTEPPEETPEPPASSEPPSTTEPQSTTTADPKSSSSLTLPNKMFSFAVLMSMLIVKMFGI